MFGRVVAALARAMAPPRVADARRRGPHARGVALFVALALQYASQPFLRARYAANARASALVLSVEIAKATLCACALLRRRETRGALRRASARSLLASGASAAVYAAQNVLLQRGARALDGVTFNCLNQTKLASAAAARRARRRARRARRACWWRLRCRDCRERCVSSRCRGARSFRR